MRLSNRASRIEFAASRAPVVHAKVVQPRAGESLLRVVVVWAGMAVLLLAVVVVAAVEFGGVAAENVEPSVEGAGRGGAVCKCGCG